MSKSTKVIRHVKNVQMFAPPAYTQKDIFQRLSSHALHPIEELKAILKELYVRIDLEARKQFETIFSLEEKLKKVNYQSDEPIHLDMPSTSKKIFFNTKPYDKIPISDYKIVDKQTFCSGPFYKSEEFSKQVFSVLIQTGKTYAEAYRNDPKSAENKENAPYGIYQLPHIPVSNIGVEYYYNRLVTPADWKGDDEKKEDPSSSSSSSSSSSWNTSTVAASSSSSSSSAGTASTFTSPDKLKEALLQLHFVIATVIQRAEAARQDRELLIRTMQDTLEDIENEQAIIERQNEPDSEDEDEGK